MSISNNFYIFTEINDENEIRDKTTRVNGTNLLVYFSEDALFSSLLFIMSSIKHYFTYTYLLQINIIFENGKMSKVKYSI